MALVKFLLVFIKRDLKTELSYRLNFLVHLGGILFQILMFYFIAKLVGPGANRYLSGYGGDYFTFVLVGIAFANYVGWASNHLSETIRNEQLCGTLENLFLAPAGSTSLIAGLYGWSFLLTTAEIAAYIVLGRFLLGANILPPDILAAVITLGLCVLSLIPFGIASAGFIMIFKKGDIISLGIVYLFQLLGGVYFPVNVLPEFLRNVSLILPITHILDAFRAILINQASLEAIQHNIFYLLVFSIVALPGSIIFFNYAVRKAKINGSLSHY